MYHKGVRGISSCAQALDAVDHQPAASSVLPSLEECWSSAAAQIESGMRSLLGNAAALDEPLAHALSVPGKRVRSLVTLAAATLDPRSVRPVPAAFDAAAAVEAIHEATLLHDDVLDDSEVRRGQGSVAARFGVRSAVFSGAYLAGKGLASIAGQCERAGLELDLGLLRDLAEAEILECLPPCADAVIRRRRLRMVADGKTGALFRLAARVGAGVALAAGAQCPDPESLDPIAVALGRGFQIRDDILDIRCDERLRRPGISDLMRGTLSWPIHFWAESSADPMRDLQRFAQCAGDPERIAAILCEVLDSGAVAQACRILDAELCAVIGHARELPQSPGRTVLLRIADGLRVT